ncbi:GNAT family N-acetyltransferase [Streptomyces antnestii]|uniref:GNAT family N-acetyltransferase n=1 Tax=Streptomyces antnestii TaxID=2494256 RepID=A0A3S2VRT9_9ACTN|nr:GNAT family N-acetyltransferase [Streptomyces sp. San01]RVU15697.1 GNAT family N-acetyltransferase [Streptomyces sp. San01]
MPSPSSAYAVGVADGEADLEACFGVRREVFVVEQRVPEELEYDEYDSGYGTVHVLARRADGEPLGTGRLLTGEAAVAKNGGDAGVGALGRLAVAKAARGLGVGVALVRAIEAAAAEQGLVAVDLHAQTQALGFYERLGYVAYGPEFPDAGIPHRAMRKTLAQQEA